MCSSGGEIAKTQESLMKSQAAFTDVLSKDYSLNFREQQQVLNQQKARLDNMVANPLGYTPTQLHLAKTSINDNTAVAAKQAIGKAAAFAAAHGAADVSGGGAGQMVGEIASEAAQNKAQQLSSLSEQDEALKRQNFMTALEGLNSVGSQYGGAGATSLGGESSAAGSSTAAGQQAQASKNAGWEHFGSVLSGVAGLGKAVSGFTLPKF